MVRSEKEPKKNPYKLSIEELTCPDKGKGKWLEQVVARQREGIEHDVRPQNLRYPTPAIWRQWISRVWNYHLSRPRFSKKEREVIRRTVEPGRAHHNRPTRRSFRNS